MSDRPGVDVRPPYPLAHWRSTSRCPKTGLVTVSVLIDSEIVRFRLADEGVVYLSASLAEQFQLRTHSLKSDGNPTRDVSTRAELEKQ